MTLELFSDQLPCVKCGSASIATKYHDKASHAPWDAFAKATVDNNAECLSRMCNRCGYAWLEEPLNGRAARGAPIVDVAQPA